MTGQNLSLYALIVGALTFSSASLAAEDAKQSIKDQKTLKLCVDYNGLTSDDDKQAYITELDRRGQLSVKDHENLKTKHVVNGSTMCGMYMMLGKPLQEEGMQIRPMVYKVVHVYPKNYYVTQVGMVVASYDRKPGELPPKLSETKPAVQPPPVIFNAPGGSPHH